VRALEQPAARVGLGPATAIAKLFFKNG
jgi:hypothetical protein